MDKCIRYTFFPTLVLVLLISYLAAFQHFSGLGNEPDFAILGFDAALAVVGAACGMMWFSSAENMRNIHPVKIFLRLLILLAPAVGFLTGALWFPFVSPDPISVCFIFTAAFGTGMANVPILKSQEVAPKKA